MSSLSLSHSASAPKTAAGLFRRVALWLEVRRSEKALARLDAHLLQDIGFEPAQAANIPAPLPLWNHNH